MGLVIVGPVANTEVPLTRVPSSTLLPAAVPQGLAGLLSGLSGAGAQSSSPGHQRPTAEPRGTIHAGAASAAELTERELLIAGMQQLQDAMSEIIKGSRADRDGGIAPTNPEAVKPGIASFPSLAERMSDEGSLRYQDWLVVISGLVCDASDTAAKWWSKVLTVLDAAYRVWLSSSPIDTLKVEPVVPQELLQGRWARVNLRICSMLMAAVPEPIKADIIAHKCTQSAPSILFRVHTTCQPGGGSEKALIQRQLHKPDSATDAPSAVLRECPPDASILSKGLASITSQVLAQHEEEAKFRTFMIRSMSNMDGQPTVEAALEYHRHLQGKWRR